MKRCVQCRQILAEALFVDGSTRCPACRPLPELSIGLAPELARLRAENAAMREVCEASKRIAIVYECRCRAYGVIAGTCPHCQLRECIRALDESALGDEGG